MGNIFCPIIRGNTNKIEQIITFDVPGTHEWIVPDNVKNVDVFLVGGGGGGSDASGGGGGYTKTFRAKNYIQPAIGTWEVLQDGGRDGNVIAVTPGESIQIIVGNGGLGSVITNLAAFTRVPQAGGYSQFKDPNYRANGGTPGSAGKPYIGGSGSSGGCGYESGCRAGSDGSDAEGINLAGKGQGHTTKDFGELIGKINAGGGGSGIALSTGERNGGYSDYTVGKGGNGTGAHYGMGGGGYGGGGGGSYGNSATAGAGGNGVVMIRYFVKPITKYDPLLNDFVNKSGVKSFTELELTSTDSFIKSLRENKSLFSKLYIMHPFIGNSELSRSLNLMDIKKAQITYTGNVEFLANGNRYNIGAGAFDLTSIENFNNIDSMFMLHNSVDVSNVAVELAHSAGNERVLITLSYTSLGSRTVYDAGSYQTGRIQFDTRPAKGTYAFNVKSGKIAIWKNGVSIGTGMGGALISVPSLIYNQGNQENKRILGISVIAKGLEDNEIIKLSEIVNNYMTALERSIVS